YPVALHGVALSIGSDQGLNLDYLKKLKKLVDRVDPLIVSDHLCWSQAPQGSSHDLLPLPMTHESLKRIVENLDVVQTCLGRNILLENISYYFQYKNSDFEEADFITEVCRRSGCDLLLDVNNVYVNSVNHGFEARLFLDRLPLEKVKQLHLAGPSQEEGYLFDTHSTPVPKEVWSLFQYLTKKNLKAPVIIEWDQDIPAFQVLESEIKEVLQYLTMPHEAGSVTHAP
ncbi:MAG: DUF692 domain-containing protein, partial [Bdellovibrionales bacterium]